MMKPRFKILADKTDITEILNGRALSITVSDEIGLVSDSLTIELDNRDSILEIPPRGAELEVYLGYDDLFSMGKFIVDEIELKSPPKTLNITARASNSTFRDMGAFKSPRSYSWKEYTLLGIVQSIAKRYGLKESVAEPFTRILVKHIDQTDESDCAFILRLASDYGATVKISGGCLLFIESLSGKFPDGSPMPIISVQMSDVTSYRMRLAERGKYGKVIAKYYDFDMAEENEIEIGASAPIFTLRDIYLNQSIALSRAKGKLDELVSGTTNLNLNMPGNPLIAAESQIELKSDIKEISGRWIVTSAKHTLNSSGYTTTLDATRPKD